MKKTKRLAIMAATGLLGIGVAVPAVGALTHNDDHPRPPATVTSTVDRDHRATTAPTGQVTTTSAPVVAGAPRPAEHPEAPDVHGSTSTTAVHPNTTTMTHPEADDTVHHPEATPTTVHHDDEEHGTSTTMGHEDGDHDPETAEHHR